MTLQISVVVGNFKPRSRTLKVGQCLAETLFDAQRDAIDVIDIVDYKHEMLEWPSDVMRDLTERVASSDVVIFASPTYKAAYTGLLKAFLDRFPADGLAGIVAIPVFTGASLGHSMAPNVTLAPLLMELGAIVPGRGFYFVVEHMDRLNTTVGAAADEYRMNLRKLARLGTSLVDDVPLQGRAVAETSKW